MPKPPAKHGSRSKYMSGCRCQPCRDAHAAYTTALRKRKRVVPDDAHGLNGYRNYGCRCEICRAAGAQANALYENRTGYHARPEVRKRKNTSRQVQQSESYATARHHYQRWTGPELEIAERSDLSAAQVAALIGRTVTAVSSMRQKLRIDPRKINAAGVSRASTQGRQ